MIIHTALYKKLVPKLPVTIPTQNGSLTYTGGVQSPGWTGFYDNLMEISGQTSGTNAGEYTVTFRLKDKEQYQWENGTVTDKKVYWNINRAYIEKPYQSNELTYTGSVLSPTWEGYDPSKMEIVDLPEGVPSVTSAINAGTYYVKFMANNNYYFADDNTTQLVGFGAEWQILKAQQNVTANPTNITLDENNKSKTINVSRLGNGTISAISSNTNVATVSVSGTTVTVTKGSGSGNATVVISVAEGDNYIAGGINIPVVVGSLKYVWDVYNVDEEESTDIVNETYFYSKYDGASYQNDQCYLSTGVKKISNDLYSLSGTIVSSTTMYAGSGSFTYRSTSSLKYLAPNKTENYFYLEDTGSQQAYWILSLVTDSGITKCYIRLRSDYSSDSPQLYFTRHNGFSQQQGTTKTGEVSSTNRNAYPDDGASGDSWYVYRGQELVYD